MRPPIRIEALRPDEERREVADERRALDTGVYVVCFATGDIGNRSRRAREPQRAAQAVLDRLDARIGSAPARAPEDLTNVDVRIALARAWPLFGRGSEVAAVCPIVGRGRVMRAHRYARRVLFDATVVPTPEALAASTVAGAEAMALFFCAPYQRSQRVGYACALGSAPVGYLSVIGAPFEILGANVR